MSEWPTYSRKQWAKAVNYSAVLGYLAVAGVPSVQSMNSGVIVGGAVLGIPFAFLCCWIFAAPVLKRLMQREISWFSAASWGAAIALLMAIVGIGIGRYRGWRQSNNPNFHAQIGGGDHVRSIDGILTPYGWLVLAQNTLIFVATGVLIALLVKWMIGEPASRPGKY